jgi:hypothetical protein
VTLQKTDEDYSPTTMYEDYLISHDQLHWQPQSSTSAESSTGQRYINHHAMGYTRHLENQGFVVTHIDNGPNTSIFWARRPSC